MANGRVFVTPAQDPTTRFAEGLSGALQARISGEEARAGAELEREKLEEASRRAEIGLEGTLGAAQISADVRREISEQAGVEAALNRQTQLEIAEIRANAQAANSMVDQLKSELALARDLNEEMGRNARNEANLQGDADQRDLEELQSNMLASKEVKDARGQTIVDGTTWAAYSSEPRTRTRRIVEGLVQRSMDPSVYQRVRQGMLETLDSAINANRILFESPTLHTGEPNPSFQDARAYSRAAQEVFTDFQTNSGSYVLQGMTSEEEVEVDLALRRELAEATEALNRQLGREREAGGGVEAFPEPGLLTP